MVVLIVFIYAMLYALCTMLNFMLALSTAWNAGRHKNGRSLVEEIKHLGFEEIELNFTLTAEIVGEIAELVKKRSIKVTSLHNYCPIPEGVEVGKASPDYYSLSALDEEERRRAVEATVRTLETAKRLGAKAVVLHLGKVGMTKTAKTLIKCYKEHLNQTEEYQKFRHQIIEERESRKEKFLDSALLSLEELGKYARRFDIAMGIENRYYFEEIPSLEEVGIILDHCAGSKIGYWHDTGHAQTSEHLGFATHRDYLDRYAQHMVGIHLHDIVGIGDHLAPLTGDFDFGILLPYLHHDTIKVIEAHYLATADQVKRGAEHLKKLFNIV